MPGMRQRFLLLRLFQWRIGDLYSEGGGRYDGGRVK